jgi:rRNA maturation endonuclease Nob1
MKYMAICNGCGKLLGQTKSFAEEELKQGMGYMIKITSFSFGECPRCGSREIKLKKDE